MSREDLEKIIQAILTDKLQSINNRLSKIDVQMNFFKEELIKLKEGVQKPGENEFFQLEFYISTLQNEVQQLKKQIININAKTDKKQKEIEKVKMNQECSLKNLSKQFDVQQEIRSMQQNIQNIAQIKQSNKPEEFNEKIKIWNHQNEYQVKSQLEKEVFKTLTGKKYHSGSCEWTSKSKIPISVKQALKEGLQPCQICNPS